MSKQQTAVEWLEWVTDIELKSVEKGIINLTAFKLNLYFNINKAKEMEKDKHERFNKFLNDEKELGISDLKTIERIQWYYNTYFNERYGGNK